MKPYYADPAGQVTLFHGDVLEVLAQLPTESVHCCVTSPPFWNLRTYGTEQWEGGEAACDHSKDVRPRGERPNPSGSGIGKGGAYSTAQEVLVYTGTCPKCGATRVDQQLGLEDSPTAFVDNLVAVFREVRRVLRNDGVCWINLGPSYNGSGGYAPNSPSNLAGSLSSRQDRGSGAKKQGRNYSAGFKALDLVPTPWMVAMALQADGWYLRASIIWHKTAPMPESVAGVRWEQHQVKVKSQEGGRYPIEKVGQMIGGWNREQLADAQYASCPGCKLCTPHDGLVLRKGSWRTTRSHEYIFMLTKTASYFCDDYALREVSNQSGFVNPSIIKAPDLSHQPSIFSFDLGAQNPRSNETNPPSSISIDRRSINSIDHPSPSLDIPHSQDNFSLTPFNSQEGQQGSKNDLCLFLPRHPEVQGNPTFGQAFLGASDLPPEGGSKKIDRFGLDLGNSNEFPKIGGIPFGADTPGIIADADASIGVNDPSEVGQNLLIHHQEYSIYNPTSSTGRNARDVWTIGPEPFTMIVCKGCKIVYEGSSYRRLINGNNPQCNTEVDVDMKCNGTGFDFGDGVFLCRTCLTVRSKGEMARLPKAKKCRVCKESQWVGHFAAFPTELPLRCIKASTSERGVCPTCGAPWARVVDRQSSYEGNRRNDGLEDYGTSHGSGWKGSPESMPQVTTLGWRSTCPCDAGEPVPAVILDPFMGSGSTAVAAQRLGQKSIGVDLNEDYLRMSIERTRQGSLC